MAVLAATDADNLLLMAFDGTALASTAISSSGSGYVMNGSFWRNAAGQLMIARNGSLNFYDASYALVASVSCWAHPAGAAAGIYFFALTATGVLSKFDGAGTLVTTYAVPTNTQQLGMSPDGSIAYCGCSTDDLVYKVVLGGATTVFGDESVRFSNISSDPNTVMTLQDGRVAVSWFPGDASPNVPYLVLYNADGSEVWRHDAPIAGDNNFCVGLCRHTSASRVWAIWSWRTATGPSSGVVRFELLNTATGAIVSSFDKTWPSGSSFDNSAYAILPSPSAGGTCSGGGEIEDIADPSNGETFSGRELAYHAWVEIGYDDEDRAYALDTFTDPTSRKIGAIISFGSIAFKLSDRDGAYRMANASIEVDDQSRFMSTLEASGGARHWLNREARIYVASEATLAAGGEPICVFRGVWRGYDTSGLTHSLSFVSRLGSSMADLSFEGGLAERLLRDDFAARQSSILTDSGLRTPVDRTILDGIVPLAYGRLSDEAIVLSEGRAVDHRRGRISPKYVGVVICLDGVERNEFVICGHAITHVDRAWIADVELDLESEILVPNSSTWTAKIAAEPFVVYNGNTYATCYLELGTTADAVIRGEKLLSLNLCGVEDVGDATGNTITRAPRVLYHLINNWGIRKYRTGLWPAPPESADGIAWLNHQSWRAMETWEYPQVGGEGYELALYLDEAITLRALLQQAALEIGGYFGETFIGQLKGVHIPNLEDLSTLETLTDVQEIVDTTTIAREVDRIENQIIVDWDYRAADKSYGHVGDKYDARTPPAGWAPDPEALQPTNGRVITGPTRQLRWGFSGVQVATQVAWWLRLGKGIPRTCQITGVLHWLRLSLGQLVKVTDFEGIGADGWTDRPLWIVGIEIKLGDLETAPTVLLSCIDMVEFYATSTGGTAAVLGADGSFVSASDGSGQVFETR